MSAESSLFRGEEVYDLTYRSLVYEDLPPEISFKHVCFVSTKGESIFFKLLQEGYWLSLAPFSKFLPGPSSPTSVFVTQL